MAMKQPCIEAVNKAAGRSLSQSELDDIEGRVRSAMRTLSVKDSAFRTMTYPERLGAAGKLAHEWLVRDTVWNQKAAIANAARKVNLLRGLDSVAPDGEGKSHLYVMGRINQADERSRVIYADIIRRLEGEEKSAPGKFFGFIQDPANDEDIAAGIFGEGSASPQAKATAESIKKITDYVLERRSQAGIPTNRLDNYGVPQALEPMRVSGRTDEFADEFPGLVNRRAYVNADGTLMSDVELRKFMKSAAETIATDGANKRENEEGSTKSRLLGSTGQRQIHYKDSKSFMYAMRKYGASSHILGTVDHYVQGQAREIALAEAFGRDPEKTINQLLDRAEVREQAHLSGIKLGDSARQKANTTRRKIATLAKHFANGYLNPARPGNERAAYWASQIRGILASSKLSAFIGALPDLANLKLAAETHNLPQLVLMRQMVASIAPGKERTEFIKRAGIYMSGVQHQSQRFMAGEVDRGPGVFLSAATHRLTFISTVDRSLRSGVGATTMHMAAEAAAKHSNVHDAMGGSEAFEGAGLNQNIWNVWRKANPETGPNDDTKILTPNSIYNISDSDIDDVAKDRIQAVKDFHQSTIDRLNALNDKERGWVESRTAKMRESLDKAVKLLNDMDSRNGVKIWGHSEYLAALKDTVDAQLEEAKLAHESLLSKAPSKSMVSVSARKLGASETRATVRVKQAKKKLSQMEKDFSAKLDTKQKALAKRAQAMGKELDEFTTSINARLTKRQSIAEEYQRTVGVAVAAERQRIKTEAAETLLNLAYREMQYAARGASAPSAIDKFRMYRNTAPGTFAGEFLRFFWQFNSVPYGIMTAHWQQLQKLEGAGTRAAYAAKYVAYGTIMGAVSMELNALVNGQNPLSINPLTSDGRLNVLDSALRGVSTGVYANVLSGKNSYGSDIVSTIGGPGIGVSNDVFKDFSSAYNYFIGSSDTKPNLPSEGLDLARQFVPFLNLFYVKAAFNHLVYDNLKEHFDPGHIQRVKENAAKHNITYWFQPGG